MDLDLLPQGSVQKIPQDATPAVGGEQAEHTLPQTGSKEHALGLLGLISLTASSLHLLAQKERRCLRSPRSKYF